MCVCVCVCVRACVRACVCAHACVWLIVHRVFLCTLDHFVLSMEARVVTLHCAVGKSCFFSHTAKRRNERKNGNSKTALPKSFRVILLRQINVEHFPGGANSKDG